MSDGHTLASLRGPVRFTLSDRGGDHETLSCVVDDVVVVDGRPVEYVVRVLRRDETVAVDYEGGQAHLTLTAPSHPERWRPGPWRFPAERVLGYQVLPTKPLEGLLDD